MKKKTKILMCSEASYLQTGYGNYCKQILSRLYDTNKYEIAEFASYGLFEDDRSNNLPWLFYPNSVTSTSPKYKEYLSEPDNVFGKWRFDKVVFDFRPDIVFDIRDYWMNSYQSKSIFRDCFNWVVMPTVDSAPQQEGWIDVYSKADAVLGYSEWAGKVLKDQSNNTIKYYGEASPGVDLEVFKPLSKKSCRESLGIPEGSIVIGSVMRNQKRKLLPDLFFSFRKLLDTYQELGQDIGNIYLYLHTSYPDIGWDIPALLKENSISNKVLFTYFCKSCKQSHASTFSHAFKFCPFCKLEACRFPSSGSGVSDDQLSIIYNTFDIYIQYSICEGFGIPQIEAAACGVPIASVDYSAMSDIVRKLDGFPIEIKRMFKELETEAYRAYPDNEHLKKILMDFLFLPQPVRSKKGFETRKLVEEHYNWDNVAKKWETVFDDIMLRKDRKQWDINRLTTMSPIDTNTLPNFNNNYELISYIFDNHIKKTGSFYDYLNLYMLKHIDYGFIVDGGEIKNFQISNFISLLNEYIKNNNIAKQLMANPGLVPSEDYIDKAHDIFMKKQKIAKLKDTK